MRMVRLRRVPLFTRRGKGREEVDDNSNTVRETVWRSVDHRLQSNRAGRHHPVRVRLNRVRAPDHQFPWVHWIGRMRSGENLPIPL